MKRLLSLIIILSITGTLLMLWWENGKGAVNPSDKTTKIFVIKKGLTIREIANQLKSEQLISDPIVFFLYLKQAGIDTQIQAGDYSLSPSMPLSSLVDTLTHGTLDVWVTFPEGLRSEEIAEIIQRNFQSYDSSWQQTFLEHNGYLFPDTYLIPKDSDKEQIIAIMRQNFSNKIKLVGLDESAYHLNDIIILASIIEREAKTAQEKPFIAGILKNRLNEGMPLQVDATVQYAKGYDEKSKRWWPTISQADYKNINSKYNTYLYTGLPPAPISNPGIESIKAAYQPNNTNYLYYLHDSSGNIHYAGTIAEHNQNVKKYISE